MMLQVQNPHSLWECLKERPEAVKKIFYPLPRGEIWKKIEKLAQALGVPIASRKEKDRVFAWIQSPRAVSLKQCFENSSSQSKWLLLDQVQDPQNVGAIFRLAAFFGINGIFLGKKRSCAMTSVVYNTACGGAEWVRFSEQSSLLRVCEFAKERGVWIVGTSERAEKNHRVFSQQKRPCLFIFGNEGKGIRTSLLKNCDEVFKIYSKGGLHSLNVVTSISVFLAQLS